MDTDSQDWVQLAYLSAQISQLHGRCEAARAMKQFGSIKAIEREIAETTAQRKRLVSNLTIRLADQVTAPLAEPAEARV